MQVERGYLFKAIVPPKITYALPVYGASQVDLNTIQCFFKKVQYIGDVTHLS